MWAEHLCWIWRISQPDLEANVTSPDSGGGWTIINVWPGLVGGTGRFLTRALTRGMAAGARSSTGRKPTSASWITDYRQALSATGTTHPAGQGVPQRQISPLHCRTWHIKDCNNGYQDVHRGRSNDYFQPIIWKLGLLTSTSRQLTNLLTGWLFGWTNK